MLKPKKSRIPAEFRRKGAKCPMPELQEPIVWKPRAAPEFECIIASFALFALLQGILVGCILALSLTGNALIHGIPATMLTSPSVKDQPTLNESTSRGTQSRMRWPHIIEIKKKAAQLYVECAQ
jgi:hypothetical protein